jgi:hypothetical protein
MPLSSRRTAGLSALLRRLASADTAGARSRSGDAGRLGSGGAAAIQTEAGQHSSDSLVIRFLENFDHAAGGAGISTVTLSVSSSTKGSS